MRNDPSELDHEAKRIKQWVEFLVVLFGTGTILALLYWDIVVLTAIATIFAWGMWTLHKDATVLDQARMAERRYRAWQDLQRQERERQRVEAEAVARRQSQRTGGNTARERDGQGPERRCPASHPN
jgi:hypothetical protein